LVTWSGGSGSVLDIYTINANAAREVFSDTYRETFQLVMSPIDASVELFVVDASLETNELEIKRFVFESDRFIEKGRVRHDRFQQALSQLFRRKE
jgi:hypothetical protein